MFRVVLALSVFHCVNTEERNVSCADINIAQGFGFDFPDKGEVTRVYWNDTLIGELKGSNLSMDERVVVMMNRTYIITKECKDLKITFNFSDNGVIEYKVNTTQPTASPTIEDFESGKISLISLILIPITIGIFLLCYYWWRKQMRKKKTDVTFRDFLHYMKSGCARVESTNAETIQMRNKV